MLDLIKSSRFQGILVVALLQSLVVFNVINSSQGESLIQIIQTVIGAAIVVRTADRNLGDVK